jgi:uncharacterized protein (DUF488 family)
VGDHDIGASRSEPLFSIGHSNHPIQAFLGLLDAHQIGVVADVRSSPYSKFVPQYNASSLKAALEAHGTRYVYLGKELGGRPDGDDFYDAEGHVLYSRVARADFFKSGIARLRKGMETHRIAILCSEEDPAVCHRHLLIGRVLIEAGIALHHIRGDGSIQDDAEVPRVGADQGSVQLAFLPGMEVDRWRSLRSVSRREAPGNSSEP